MTEGQVKRVIVVLSPGRSGSSLLMKALGTMGMNLSGTLMPGSMGNPDGFFEDTEILQAHKELLEGLHAKPTLPMPDGWLESDSVKRARPKLRKILESRLSQSAGIWGFKDPRTVSLLPLWSMILNAPGIVPVFLLSVRNPANVAISLKRQINRKGAITENQWLIRTTEALQHTAADCYIVHYEDWFTRPHELSQGLLQYTGLDQYFKGNLDQSMKRVIKPNLNRSFHDEYTIQNEYVLTLYDVLKECRGYDFDRERLMTVVRQCRKAMDGFKGWYLEAQKFSCLYESVIQKAQKRTAQITEEQITGMQSDLQSLTQQNNIYIKQIKELHDEIENLRKQVTQQSWQTRNPQAKIGSSILHSEIGNLSNWQREAIELRYSYSFRLGKILIDAVMRPGKNTLYAPYHLLVLAWEMVSGRGRKKANNALEQGS